ncbi:MAG: rhodanese-like domain-containing protein [Opitutaceae bacterium]|nr:rhodanese-like domain-containing protein [Opitutaceae bacterium]
MNFLKAVKSLFTSAPRVMPADAAGRVRAGQAILIDVRETGEWRSGVAESAVLLPLTDLMGARARWKPFLASADKRELLMYCAAGGRSAIAAKILVSEGFKAADAGSIRDWKTAGWPVVPPAADDKTSAASEKA